MAIVASDKSRLPKKIGDNYQVKKLSVNSRRTLTAREIILYINRAGELLV